MNTEQQIKYLTLINYLIVFISFLIAVNIEYILIRASSIMANDDIGLYEDGNQNSFKKKTAINYIFDIILIILYGIEICFSIRLKTVLKTDIFVLVIKKEEINVVQNEIHIQQNINVNGQLTMNDNHNNYNYINNNYNSNNYNSNNYINNNINNINNNDNNNNNIEGRDKYEASVNLPFKPV